MYMVSNRVFVTADYQEAFEQRFRNRAGQVDKQAGFVRMDILRPQEADSPYVVQTVWQDKHSFEQWVGSEDFKLAHQNPLPKEAYSGEGQMEAHEIVISSSAGV